MRAAVSVSLAATRPGPPRSILKVCTTVSVGVECTCERWSFFLVKVPPAARTGASSPLSESKKRGAGELEVEGGLRPQEVDAPPAYPTTVKNT